MADIIFSEVTGREGNIGLITLNRPSVLNALNQAMFNELDNQLTEWQTANHIKAVIIRAAEGRAFCAGGDVRSAYERRQKNDPNLMNFFRDEYQLNRRIFHYGKPYIALLDGITMGGGAGISIHASHRVGTQQLTFAMPETNIGFYPDVGATYFLSRLPNKIGIYLGLTGARITANDCYALGLVNCIIDKAQFPDLIYQLADTVLKDHANILVTRLLEKFAITAGQSELLPHREEISSCFSKSTVEEIILALETYPSEWCRATATDLKTKSPTSLKVTLRALHEAEKKDFDGCMDTEYCLTEHFLNSHDFFEGVRAAIIDKDRAPKWRPAHLEDVKAQDIERYFLSPENAQNSAE